MKTKSEESRKTICEAVNGSRGERLDGMLKKVAKTFENALFFE